MKTRIFAVLILSASALLADETRTTPTPVPDAMRCVWLPVSNEFYAAAAGLAPSAGVTVLVTDTGHPGVTSYRATVTYDRGGVTRTATAVVQRDEAGTTSVYLTLGDRLTDFQVRRVDVVPELAGVSGALPAVQF